MTAAAWPQNYVKREPTKLDNMASGWAATSCTASLDSEKNRTGNPALKIVPSATTCYVGKNVTWPIPHGPGGAPYHVLVYCQNLNTNTFCRFRIWSGSGSTGNDMHYDWNQNNLREGWNDLTIHPNEDGTTTYTSGNTWSVNVGTQAAIIAAPVLSARVEFRNCQGANNPTFWIGGIYQDGRAMPSITFGFDTYGRR